jgi:hypothetical protein
MGWKHYICEISGKPAFVLIDERFANQSPIKELPRLSWFGVYCNLPTGEAFWNPEEADTLDRIENDLIRLSETFGHGWVAYVLRIATTGIREYYLYHADQAELSKAFTALKAIYGNYQIEFETTNDIAWEQYGRYVSYASGSTP